MDIFQFYNQSAAEKVPVLFKGPLFHDVLYNLAECVMQQISNTEKIKNKVLASFIELAQNVKLYSQERIQAEGEESDAGVGMMVFKELDQHYVIMSGNLMRNADVKPLITKCQYINTLNRENLNRYYREERNRSIESGLQGGNTGLIELVRRSNNPLEVGETSVDEAHSFITIAVTINKTN